MRDFSRALSKLQLTARNSNWFIALFDPVVISRSNYFWYRFFRQSFENRSNCIENRLVNESSGKLSNQMVLVSICAYLRPTVSKRRKIYFLFNYGIIKTNNSNIDS